MPYQYEINKDTGGVLFRRSTIDRNISLVVGLAAVVLFLSGLLVGKNWFGIIKLILSAILLVFSFLNYLRYLRLAELMYFSNRKQSFIVGNWEDYAEIPYAEIKKIDIGKEVSGSGENYYLYLCLEAGGRWYLQAFGKKKEEAEIILKKLNQQMERRKSLYFEEKSYMPTISKQEGDHGISFFWHSKELYRYLQMFVFFIPFSALLIWFWKDFSDQEKLYSLSFLTFSALVAMYKIVKGYNTYRSIELLDDGGVRVTLKAFGRIEKERIYSSKKNHQFILNFFPLSSNPAFSANYIIVNKNAGRADDGLLNFEWLKKQFLGNSKDVSTVDVQSLSIAQRIDLYFYLRRHCEIQNNNTSVR